MKDESGQKQCPKCGRKNPESNQYCGSCGCLLMQAPAAEKRSNVKVSKLASTSFYFALFGLVLLAPSLFAVGVSRLLSPRQRLVGITFLASFIVLVISFILGLLGIVQIERSGGRIIGRAFAVGAVLVSVFGGLLPAWFVVINRTRSTAYRMVCGINLAGLGKAMVIYSQDYDHELPRAGGKSSVWASRIPDWEADNPFEAFDMQADMSGGQGSISSSLYFLVKYYDVSLKSFVCGEDCGTTEFKPAKYGMDDSLLFDLWDFGPNPPMHCSYSYHVPFGGYRLTAASEPGMAVAADRNPWIDSPFEKARNFQAFDPNGSTPVIMAGNAIAHKTDGQNVLFLDNHVGFEKRSFCGVNDDNIYTFWNGADIQRGTPAQFGSQPADRMDSLLVNDPAISP